MAGPDGDQRRSAAAVRIEPRRPATRGQLIAGFLLGPILWLGALILAAIVVDESSAIALGLAVTVASFLIALPVLWLMFIARRRQEKRFVDDR